MWTLFFFFLLAMLALARPRRQVWRVLFGGYVVTGMLVANFTHQHRWPFESWNLYRLPAPTSTTITALMVVDSAGSLLRYDDRALGRLTTPTNLSRHADRLLNETDATRRDVFVRFLLHHANTHRDALLQSRPEPPSRWLRFPPHQFGHRWDRADVMTRGPFRSLAVLEIRLDLSDDGRHVLRRDERVVMRFSVE